MKFFPILIQTQSEIPHKRDLHLIRQPHTLAKYNGTQYRKTMIKHFRLLFFIFLTAIVLSGTYMWFNFEEKHQVEIDYVVDEILITIANRLKGNEDYIQLLAQMRNRNELTLANFDRFAKPYLDKHPELINITWIDEQFYIRSVVPMEGNEQIIGLHLDLPEPAWASQQAKETREPVYTKPFEAIQGNCSFEIWVPVFRGDEFLGLFAGVYSCQKLLESPILPGVYAQYGFQIVDDNNAILAKRENLNARFSGVTYKREFPLGNSMHLSVQDYSREQWDFNLLTLLLATLISGSLTLWSIVKLQNEVKNRIVVQKNLEQANSELLLFAYHTSHDLRSPLASIRGLANFIREDVAAGDTDEVKINATKISGLAMKLENLIDDITQLTRVQHENLETEQLDFDEMLNQIREKWAELMAENQVQFSATVDLPTPFWGERARFSIMLDNLISNSIKYCDLAKAYRFIKVHITNDTDTLFIDIVDNGLGIPAEFQKKVFEMFKRFHPQIAFGSGLGLYLVKKHIQKMNGNIRLESSGDGTVIYITIPKNYWR